MEEASEALFDPLSEATPQLQRLLGKAALISEISPEDFDISFTSTLIAFLYSDDPLSRWFQEYVKEKNVAVEEILRYKNLDREELEITLKKKKVGKEFPESSSEYPLSVTMSMDEIFSEARKLMRTVSKKGLLDVRHLMGAYIYRPGKHKSQLKMWKFNREDWSNEFLLQIEDHFPAERSGWYAEHSTVFGKPPELEHVKPEKKKSDEKEHELSAHISKDLWTSEDTLGYYSYAIAISQFLLHPRTEPPLTISIQAPWGGGKTSLMRMIQKELDPKALKLYEEREPASKSEEMNLKKLQDKLSDLIHDKRLDFRISEAEKEGMKRLTIWFNAWKYESIEQVWAGLADTIVKQFADRLEPEDREKFWLHLNLQRLDAGKIRRRIYRNVLASLWHQSQHWLIGSVLGLVLAIALILGIPSNSEYYDVGFYTGILSLVTGVFKVVKEYGAAMNDPAEFYMGEYMRIPDYSTQLGFVHHVEKDLNQVLKMIREKGYSPMVIFIDDLDRCSPCKVADVVEAINLFLAGEFQNCIFVIGMDPQMVAAALEKAHSEVIDKLPDYAKGTIGWRFMDKFVQLPFVVPSPEGPDLKEYVRSLFCEDKTGEQTDEKISKITNRTQISNENILRIDEYAAEIADKEKLDEDQKADFTRKLKEKAVRSSMEEDAKRFSDKDPEIRNLILGAAPDFSNNPRDLKRFFNMFRFLWFLRQARKRSGLPAPSLKQLQRWVILSMKWPGVVRWACCRRGGSIQNTKTRLENLETIGKKSKSLEAWETNLQEELQLEAEKTPWIRDRELMKFFQKESSLKKNLRLSAAAGLGLW